MRLAESHSVISPSRSRIVQTGFAEFDIGSEPDIPDLVREYFDAAGDLRLMQERLFDELPWEHADQRLLRQRMLDQDETLSETDEEFEEKCRQEAVKVEDEIGALRLRVDRLHAQAVSAGLDPDPLRYQRRSPGGSVADWLDSVATPVDMAIEEIGAVQSLVGSTKSSWPVTKLEMIHYLLMFGNPTPDRTERSVADISGLQSRKDYGQDLLSAKSRKDIHDSRNNKTPRECVASGYVAGTYVEALADSCAGNFVSDAYLRTLGVTYEPGDERDILVGNGLRAFKTLGTIRLPWAFAKESTKSYLVEFDVIPARFCDYTITLGGKFLSATKTLTERLKDRIIRRLRRTTVPRLFYQGGSHLRMSAYCGGVPVAALADTGSDLDLVSPEMLLRLGYDQRDVLTSDAHRVFVELPGGLIVRTSGMIHGVDFRFGDGRAENSYLRDFYVLPGLPGDVLIGQDLLWDSDAFSRYSDCLTEFDDHDVLTTDIPEGMFLNIKLVQEARSWFTRSKKRATNEIDLEAHKQWEAQCKSVLDEVENMHRREMEEEARKDEILKLEQKYRQLMQSPSKPATPAGRNHRPRPAPPSANSPAMM